MKFLIHYTYLVTFAVLSSFYSVLATPSGQSKKAFNLPFTSKYRWIVGNDGSPTAYVGINWPGHGAVMIPEGLQHESIENIVNKISGVGMNVIRLTFAIEMIDDIYENSADTTVHDSFVNDLGEDVGEEAYSLFLKNNPQFNNHSTRLDVFDAVAKELAKNGIYVHLDNHISKAMWCCSGTDGNSWFGDTYFDVDNWKRGLSYMVAHGKKWSNLASIGLRNELRTISSGHYDPEYPNTWKVWADTMTDAAAKVHESNPDILIFFGGRSYDTTLETIVFGNALDSTNEIFNIEDYSFKDKMVFELHTYASVGSCDAFWSSSYKNGFAALNESDNTVANRLPVVLTEWGHNEDDTSDKFKDHYHVCLHQFVKEHKIGWMLWSLAGSYYWRQETYDFEDTWGLVSKDWSSYRGNASTEAIIEMVSDALNSDADKDVHY